MKRKLQLIALTMLLPILAVCTLGYVTLRQDKPNGFIRKFREGYAQKVAETKYNFNLYDICGTTSSAVYFRTDNPALIYSYPFDLKTWQMNFLNIPENPRIKQFFKTVIDSPFFSVFAGNISLISKGRLGSSYGQSTRTLQPTLFNDIVEYSPNHYIVRRFDERQKDFVFQKMDSIGHVISEEHALSIKTPQVGIASQGTLLFDKNTGRLYYIYRLFNKMLCFDTSLKSSFIASTIDTITVPVLNSSEINKKDVRFKTYSSPPQYTNYRACLSKGTIYVHSLLKSDNESHSRNTTTIDAYSVTDGKYMYSFHLPDNIGKMGEFTVTNGLLIAVYKNQRKIVSYRIQN